MTGDETSFSGNLTMYQLLKQRALSIISVPKLLYARLCGFRIYKDWLAMERNSLSDVPDKHLDLCAIHWTLQATADANPKTLSTGLLDGSKRLDRWGQPVLLDPYDALRNLLVNLWQSDQNMPIQLWLPHDQDSAVYPEATSEDNLQFISKIMQNAADRALILHLVVHTCQHGLSSETSVGENKIIHVANLVYGLIQSGSAAEIDDHCWSYVMKFLSPLSLPEKWVYFAREIMSRYKSQTPELAAAKSESKSSM